MTNGSINRLKVVGICQPFFIALMQTMYLEIIIKTVGYLVRINGMNNEAYTDYLIFCLLISSCFTILLDEISGHFNK